MRKTTIEIDGEEVRAEEGETILEAARKAGFDIPTLCYDEELEPYGACRICSVEVEKGGIIRVVASCCYPVEKGLKVRTRTPKIERLRRTIIELAAVTAGEDVAAKMSELAYEYGADLSRFRSRVEVEPTKCILCGLCVRRCIVATGDGAIGFVGRGVNRVVAIFPEKSRLCSTCAYCRRICPTGRISPAYGPNPPFPYVDDVLAGRVHARANVISSE